MKKYISELKTKSPIIHCITNVVTINSCANALLAVGARPIMAMCEDEMSDIAAQADAHLVNIGTIADYELGAIRAVFKNSAAPIVLDCVGASASRLRLALVKELISIKAPYVIKGNASEIMAVCAGEMSMSGVDSAGKADIDAVSRYAQKTGAIIAVTGAEDLIFSGDTVTAVANGCADMTRVTGTGCMTGCLIAALGAAEASQNSAAYAVATMGICGELAQTDKGTGTFYVNLIDALSTVTDDIIEERKRVRIL